MNESIRVTVCTATIDDTGDPAVQLCCEYNLHNLPARPQRRRKKVADVPAECRVVSLTSLNCSEVVREEEVSQSIEDVCVVAGCSDGMIRYY